MFDITKVDLTDILRDVNSGRLQLPDFQRDYVWEDKDVRSLIASVAKGFPVGSLLTLETGGQVRFKPRLIEGVKPTDTSPTELLLDGQQRITSLYQSMYSCDPVKCRTPRKTEVYHFYYVDIKKAISDKADIEEAILAVPSDKIVRTNFGREVVMDLREPSSEFELDLFPLNKAFDSPNWFFAWMNQWQDRGRDLYALYNLFRNAVLHRIDHYKMPIIRLDSQNSREAICLVFEKVNVGGKKLGAFELVTAVYAADNFDLREDWNGTPVSGTPGRHARMIGSPNRRDVLAGMANTDFLQACTLLYTREVRSTRAQAGVKEQDLPQISCKREALLSLPLDAYKQFADAVQRGFIEASSFLNELKIIWHRDVPYPPLVIALASTFAVLEDAARSAESKRKLSQWFWSVTLGELYGSSTDSRLARDVPELIDWLGSTIGRPKSLDEAFFQKDRLRSLRSRSAAAYKGIHALLMKHGCKDFISGRPADIMTFYQDKIDIHHIFPKAWCRRNDIPPSIYNSIVNKTPLSQQSNVIIGGNAPSVYLTNIEEEHGLSSTHLDDILRTHLIEPELLRADDFYAFFEKRAEALASLVAEAMGKPVFTEAGTNEQETDVGTSDDDIDEDNGLQEVI